MSDIDLDTLSLADLKELEKNVSKAIANFEARRLKDARTAVSAEAKEMGFTLEELVESSTGKKSKSVSLAKYRHPENASITWSGRDRKPMWFIEAIERGTSEEVLLIN